MGGWVGANYYTYQGFIESNMLCAHEEGEDACLGDSGGPIVVPGNEDNGNGNGADDLQVGIVSFGVGCANPDFPGIYARISDQFRWIDDVVCEISDYPPSDFGCATSPPTRTPTTASPTEEPTVSPTVYPTVYPTEIPTEEPTEDPTERPSASPSASPSAQPTTETPTENDNKGPSLEGNGNGGVPPLSGNALEIKDEELEEDDDAPSGGNKAGNATGGANDTDAVPYPLADMGNGTMTGNGTLTTDEPTPSPTSSSPTVSPTVSPTTPVPTSIPTSIPTSLPSSSPTDRPSSRPSAVPTSDPSSFPSDIPSDMPTSIPSYIPSMVPTGSPTGEPTRKPVDRPQPTWKPASPPIETRSKSGGWRRGMSLSLSALATAAGAAVLFALSVTEGILLLL
uniref:Peptidase S1 domain-containing protein n=1 Tax=Odontella aurita TaxID=265563 RepID=A0A7S4MEM4_9STRA|mmetsp:Transcript_19284/g.56252  ORF Transcript_19284/g.56252 Transcript_19284/m.56252 type:complete len:396 (+) Transcript_19284:1238-2425(+)